MNIFKLLLFACLLPFGMMGAEISNKVVSLTWDPPLASGTNLTHKLRIGTAPGIYNTEYFITNSVVMQLTNVVAGVTNYAVVTVVLTNGLESLPSNELQFTYPLPPSNLRILRPVFQSSITPFGPWKNYAVLDSVVLIATNSSSFYRMSVEIEGL